MGEVDRGKNKVPLGRREDGKARSVPRWLSLTLSPASKLPTRPKAKEASAEERESFTVRCNLNQTIDGKPTINYSTEERN